MRIAIAGMSHETNTFSPVRTDLARFSGGASAPPEGNRAVRIYRGTATCMAGFIAPCEARGDGPGRLRHLFVGRALAGPPKAAS